MARYASSSTTAELVLLVDGYLTGAIIGKGGSTLKSIKGASGVHTLQLSQERSSTRTVSVTGPADAVHAAYQLISEALSAEADRVRLAGGRPSQAVRLLLPKAQGAQLLAKQGAAVRALRRASGASIELDDVPHGQRRLLRCAGTAAQTAAAVRGLIELAAEREGRRHASFLARWPFETSYNDHFETPRQAYADVLPLMRSCAEQALRPLSAALASSSTASTSSTARTSSTPRLASPLPLAPPPKLGPQ